MDWLPDGLWLDTDPTGRWSLIRPTEISTTGPIRSDWNSQESHALLLPDDSPVQDIRNGKISRDGRYFSSLILQQQWYLCLWDTDSKLAWDKSLLGNHGTFTPNTNDWQSEWKAVRFGSFNWFELVAGLCLCAPHWKRRTDV